MSYEAAHRRLTGYMRSRGMKLTKQRELILRTFLDSGKHIAVDELLRLTRDRDAGVGHATVYRTMKLLVEAGVAVERNFTEGAAKFEPAEGEDDHHDHLICERCGKILEFENEEIERLQQVVALAHGFDLTHHKMVLYGDCRRGDRCPELGGKRGEG